MTYTAPASQVQPESVACPYCRAPAGQRCGIRGWLGRPARPHKRRVKLALALAAHADPALDAHFPHLGPCGICSVPGLDQRHRVIDAIAGSLAAGEDPEVVADDYAVPLAAVQTVTEWAARWPGVWL